MWVITVCVMIWYIHAILTLPNQDSAYLRGEREKGDL
jgi:REP element-mobilizing transposase RayT